MKKISAVLILVIYLNGCANNPQSNSASKRIDESPEKALENCMNKNMMQGAVVGALVGGLIGAALGGADKKGSSAAVGAGLGAAAGGAFAWQKSWKSCNETLNLVTNSNSQTQNFKDTAQRLKYNGKDNLLKVENIAVPSTVYAGKSLDVNFTYALLKQNPNATSTVQIDRMWNCGDENTSIRIPPEIFTTNQGTFTQTGKIPIPFVKPEIGVQKCQMTTLITAEGQKQEFKRQFVIQPG
jgi:uncharacterized protein YcfJ